MSAPFPRADAETTVTAAPVPLVEIRGLRTHFFTESGVARAVDGVDLDIMRGEVLGLVGESGSGKSVTALSILRLVPDPPGRIVGGEVRFKGRDLLRLSWDEIRSIRGREISMIFQEPMTSLNPVFKIGMQVMEVILAHERVPEEQARARAEKLLNAVGIPDPQARMNQYPHELSGGMRQRVMIAIALALNPALLIADEPTTALDVTIQAQILDLMLEMKDRDDSILLITHNLAVVAETCDRVAVMYGGKIQEVAPVRELFHNPLHPYTRGLLASLPRVDGERAERLTTIPGSVPDIHELPPGCKFTSRCTERFEPCQGIEPPLIEAGPGHWVRCHLHDSCHGYHGRHS
ncbi:MAG TPA: ABC transporter ATP-binding protein [Vicinamibacterales bacterium]|jgi:oligopeptide/dipeptide ABC transporter ATP-binding protein|nr:ABC transporter ATP-binding protein [Vicinamibacterales bacterium]